MLGDNMIRAADKADKGILLVAFAPGMLTLQGKAICLICFIPGITTTWNYWNLLDLVHVFDAVMILLIVLPTWVRFSQIAYCFII